MKYSSNSILALIPQTEEGKSILLQSLFFQKKLEKRIFILDLIKADSKIPLLFKTKKTDLKLQEELNKLKHFVKDTIGHEIPKKIILRTKTGDLLSTLINESKKGGYEFIIIDKSEDKYKNSLSRVNLNTFISKSFCPVIAINKNHPVNKIKTIVVPIDISQTIKKRLFWATLFAKKFDAKIKIVSVLNVDISKTKSLAFKNAEKIKHMLKDRGVECDVKILKAHDQPKHKAVLDYIEKKQPELVIIRSHQESRFTGKKIGKFVSEIIHGCKIPVFTVGGSTENHPVDF